MYVYICICICIYVYMYTCVYVYVCVRAPTIHAFTQKLCMEQLYSVLPSPVPVTFT